jgi:hypothetical protein
LKQGGEVIAMSRHAPDMRLPRALAAVAAAALLLAPIPTRAQRAPADLTRMPPVSTSHVPAKTPWGDPDFRGTFPLENIDLSRIRLVRPKDYGNRFWVTEEEYAARLATAKRSDAAYSAELGGRGTKGLALWIEKSAFARSGGAPECGTDQLAIWPVL